MSDANRSMTSIILVTRNKLDYTKRCVESVKRHTEKGDYELIIVDNGSTDETIEWVNTHNAQNDIKIISNGYDMGYSKACNQGIEIAAGELIMLLDYNMIVTPGWLYGLKRCLLSDRGIGAVSPATNSEVYSTTRSAAYQTIEELELFASALHANLDKNKWEERITLSRCCLLMKREAYQKAGVLDETAAITGFEGEDYGLRLRLVGYRHMLCGDTFIHHYGSESFKSEPEQPPQKKEDGFLEKWGFHPILAAPIQNDFNLVIQRESYEYKHEGCSIMEINCGCGAILLQMKKQFPDAKWFGIEQNELAARVAEVSGMSMVFRSTDQESWRLPDEGLDGIMIHHAHDYGTPQKIRKLMRLLKPNGWLIGSFANRYYYENIREYLDPAHTNALQQASMQFTVRQLEQLYTEAGFVYTKLTLAELNAENDQLAYIEQLEQLTGGMISKEELGAPYCLAFGRVASSAMEDTDLFMSSEQGEEHAEKTVTHQSLLVENTAEPFSTKG